MNTIGEYFGIDALKNFEKTKRYFVSKGLYKSLSDWGLCAFTLTQLSLRGRVRGFVRTLKSLIKL